ncbi:hypothetical protein LIER_33830 [Lithospermum erythrorhizon]|uniref:MULE transposase domain-containing protein n=1 Tax=Lithospermum erythrorhizon TaxID=34254 RepID=A0AAV3S1P2_LITER
MNFHCNYDLINLDDYEFLIDKSNNIQTQLNTVDDVFEDVSHEFGTKCRWWIIVQNFSYPASYAIVNAYPQILIIDTTYNTNEHEMDLLEAVRGTSTDKTFTTAYTFMAHERVDNFKYVLQFIRGLYHTQVVPNDIITDRDHTLMNAVDVVFPESQKQLCRLYIEQCVLQRALQQPGFMKEMA